MVQRRQTGIGFISEAQNKARFRPDGTFAKLIKLQTDVKPERFKQIQSHSFTVVKLVLNWILSNRDFRVGLKGILHCEQ